MLCRNIRGVVKKSKAILKEILTNENTEILAIVEIGENGER